MKSKVKANFIYNTAYHIFLIIVPLITTPYVSRRLGAAGIGDYAFAYSIAYYFSLFIKLGLNNYGNRAVAYVRDDKEKLSREFWNIYCFQFLLAIAVTALYLAYCFLFAGNRQISIYLLLFVISAGLDITWFFWGMEEFKITVTRSVIIKILCTAAIFLFVKTEEDTGIYTLILSIGFLGGQIFVWPRLFKYVSFVRPEKAEVIRHIKPNLVLFLPAIAVSLYKIMDKIMLGWMSSKTEVGFYESSEKIIKIPMAIIESLGAVMQPRMSNLVSNHADSGYLRQVLRKSVLVAVFFSTLLGFGIMSIAGEFVPLFYGQGFDKCVTLYMILLPSCMFLSFTNVIKSQYLLPQKKDREYIIALFTGAAVNLTANALLIPGLASVGAAIGTLLAEISVCFVIAWIVHGKIRISEYFLITVPFAISGAAMLLAGRLIHFSAAPLTELFIKVLICGLIYIIILCTIMPVTDRIFSTHTKEDVKGFLSSLTRMKAKFTERRRKP